MNFKKGLSTLLSCLVTLSAVGSVNAMDDSSSASADSKKTGAEINEDLSLEYYLIFAVTFGVAFWGTRAVMNAYDEHQRRRNLEQTMHRFRHVQPVENEEHQPLQGELEVSNYHYIVR